ncbi:MAG: DUF4350 domain-containing protein [Actinobacteria bacterium]|nr:DUF4350 domain-containing protein [Actinomycetota bacterium]
MSTAGRAAAATDAEPGAADATAPADDLVLWRWLWRQLREWWALLVLALAILVVAVVTAVLPDKGVPLDPESTGANGTRALVEVLEALGREVEIADPDEVGAADIVLLLDDKLGDTARTALRRRVEDGARLVLADPGSPLAPEPAGGVGFLDRVLSRDCDVAALGDVATLRPRSGVAYEVPDGGVGCFDTPDGSWLVIEPVGRGHVAALGSAEILMNSQLGDADHAVLAVQLLTPAGGGPVTVVRPTLGAPADAQVGLADLVPAGVRVAVLQLLVAFGVLVVWRARRLGPPLVDEPPVALASAEQTVAVGVLFARNGARAATIDRIARDTRRRAARRLGLPAGATASELSAAIAERTGQDGAVVAAALEPDAPADDAALLRATAELAAVERGLHETFAHHDTPPRVTPQPTAHAGTRPAGQEDRGDVH